MRRKSTRTSGKQSPDKGKVSDSPIKKSRRSSKRRRKSSESENSEEEQDIQHNTFETESTAPETNTDTENNETVDEKGLDVHSEVIAEKPEKKFKLKRSRSSGTNDEDSINAEDKHLARRSRRRGSPKAEERTHQEDDDDDKVGKGKSKSKTKSKIEKSQPPNESETHNESEISTNAQVTPQSPQIVNTNLVDNVVDVAGNAEGNKSESENEDRNKDTKDMTEIDEQEVSTEMIDDKTTQDESNYNQVNESVTTLCEQKNEIDSNIVNSNNVESNTNVAENKQDNSPSEPLDCISQTNNAKAIEILPEDVNKPEEGFTGFPITDEQAKQTKPVEFVEEPMDISADITFTIKTDESSINITEDTNDDNVNIVETNHTKALGRKLNRSNTNQKIILNRDINSKITLHRKKEGWGLSTISLDLYTITTIDSKVMKNIYTDILFLDESEVKLDLDIKDRRRSFTEGKERARLERSISVNDTEYRKNDIKDEDKEHEDNSNIIAMNRKISIVDDSASKLKPPPSPAKNPLSNVLFITNLVRPFTLKQLKELLERTGVIKENGFWTDRIKSKCYVHYQNIEDAEATRNALHGVHWPIGNGKKLIIDYSTEDDLENARNPPSTPPLPEPVKIEKENVEPQKKPKEQEEEKSREKIKEKRRHEHIREWDVGKAETRRDRSRSRNREKPEKRRHSRHSPSPFEDYLTRKQKKADEQVPQKLMDDLFQKTKTTPSIYWQPLSPEEIATKQQQRLERMAEHKRRLEESTRTRAEFGRGGPYRRRYD